MKTFSSMLILFCIIFTVYISGCGTKEEENKTSQKETASKNKTETQQQSTTQTQPHTKTNTPTSETGKIWSQVEKINESMGKSINSGKSGHLEEPVAEIISLIKTIPEKIPNLDQANLEVIKTKVNELRKIGGMMDRYQHDNKITELKAEYAKFNSALNEIKKVLPM
ncbi:MAG: hypothetical protein JNJ56_10365 [Ignavibacteria bacterium]|nr:hypothetical protein [Ignavibacteria bacterium]